MNLILSTWRYQLFSKLNHVQLVSLTYFLICPSARDLNSSYSLCQPWSLNSVQSWNCFLTLTHTHKAYNKWKPLCLRVKNSAKPNNCSHSYLLYIMPCQDCKHIFKQKWILINNIIISPTSKVKKSSDIYFLYFII